MNPFSILNLETHYDISDKDVRQNYLKMIKKYSPDREPEKFAVINKAYNLIKTKRDRISFLIENTEECENSPMEVLKYKADFSQTRKPLSDKRMKEFFIRCTRKI